MTVLSGPDIKRRLEESDIENQLVISPLLAPEEQLQPDQASIDVKLGFEFTFFSPSAYAAIDEFDKNSATTSLADLSGLYRKQYVSLGNSIVIHPHQFILAVTLEYLRLPSDLMAYVVGRSTWGRLGLIVATAIGIHPGFAGSLTLELRNLGEAPIRLYPGQTIGQLFFHKLENSVTADPDYGQYSGQVDTIPRRISKDETKKIINKIRDGD